MSPTRFASYILLAAFFLTAGCMTPKPSPDPLAGWKPLFGSDREEVDVAIKDDCQKFIQTLPPDQRGYNLGPIFFFEDSTGQHAASFEVFESGNSSWRYAVIYDKENNRVNVIKYGHRRYQS